MGTMMRKSSMRTRYIFVVKCLNSSQYFIVSLGVSETSKAAEFVMERFKTATSLFDRNGSQRAGRFWGKGRIHRHHSGIVPQTPLHRSEFGQRLVSIDCPEKANQDRTKNGRTAIPAPVRHFVPSFSTLYGRVTFTVGWYLSLDAKFSSRHDEEDVVFRSFHLSDP